MSLKSTRFLFLAMCWDKQPSGILCSCAKQWEQTIVCNSSVFEPENARGRNQVESKQRRSNVLSAKPNLNVFSRIPWNCSFSPDQGVYGLMVTMTESAGTVAPNVFVLCLPGLPRSSWEWQSPVRPCLGMYYLAEVHLPKCLAETWLAAVIWDGSK